MGLVTGEPTLLDEDTDLRKAEVSGREDEALVNMRPLVGAGFTEGVPNVDTSSPKVPPGSI